MPAGRSVAAVRASSSRFVASSCAFLMDASPPEPWDPSACLRLLPHALCRGFTGSMGLSDAVAEVYREQHPVCCAALSAAATASTPDQPPEHKHAPFERVASRADQPRSSPRVLGEQADEARTVTFDSLLFPWMAPLARSRTR